MSKNLYMLIGPKGSGKTYIGRLIAKNSLAVFVEAERIWLNLQDGQSGWQAVEEQIDREFSGNDRVFVESLGAGDEFRAFYTSLKAKYLTKMIRISAGLETCLKRVQERGARDQLPIPLGKVAEYNEIAAAVEFDWVLEIDNEGPAAEADILAAIKKIM